VKGQFRLPLIATHNWRAAMREFIIVVTGVLAALAAQAWWERQQEREVEREYLSLLLADARINEARLAEAIQRDSVSLLGAGRALAALDGATLVAADSFLTWLGWAASSTELRPMDGSFQAIISSGDLRLIRNDTLRAEIVSYASAIKNETARLQQLRGSVLDVIYPLGQELPFLRGALLGTMTPEQVNLPMLREDEQAAALLFTMQATAQNRLEGLRSIQRETRRIRQLLEAQGERNR
jgi:hypothetical protein